MLIPEYFCICCHVYLQQRGAYHLRDTVRAKFLSELNQTIEAKNEKLALAVRSSRTTLRKTTKEAFNRWALRITLQTRSRARAHLSLMSALLQQV